MSRLARTWEAWERFWFAPQSTSVVALWRIAFGLVALGWALALAPDLFTWYSQTGLEPKAPPGWGWGLLKILPQDWFMVALYGLLVVGCLALIVGWHSRLASIVVFVAMISFQRREPYILNSGDVVLRVTAFFLMFAPTGAALSVDRWRSARERFWESPLRAPWALRLMQVQLSVIYLSAVWAKLQGDSWNNGTAVYYAFTVNHIHRLPIPGFILDSELIVNLLTYGTLVIEAAIGILVWNKAARPYVLAAGVLLHLGIDYAILVVFFSYAMFVCYTTFVLPEWLDEKVGALRARLARSEVGPLRAIASAEDVIQMPRAGDGGGARA